MYIAFLFLLEFVKMTSYRTCSVPMCGSTTLKYPEKLFIHVPQCPKRRKQWLQLARRDPKFTSVKSALFFCEDHFDLPNDMENYIRYKVMGFVSTVKMKPDCLPSKFQCQPDRRKRTAPPQPRSAVTKRRRMEIIQEIFSKKTEMPATSSIQRNIRVTQVKGQSIRLYRVKAQVGHVGNMPADSLAKQAALNSNTATVNSPYPIAIIRTLIRAKTQQGWQPRYDEETTADIAKVFPECSSRLGSDLQYSDSGSSGLEEVEQKDVAEAMVQLSVRPEDMSGEPSFDTSEFLIKREAPDEPPQISDELVDLDQHSRDYTYPAVVKEEPMETDLNIEPPEPPLLDAVPGELPQFKEEPLENWQPDPAIQDDLQVTDSEEEAEDGLWF